MLVCVVCVYDCSCVLLPVCVHLCGGVVRPVGRVCVRLFLWLCMSLFGRVHVCGIVGVVVCVVRLCGCVCVACVFVWLVG